MIYVKRKNGCLPVAPHGYYRDFKNIPVAPNQMYRLPPIECTNCPHIAYFCIFLHIYDSERTTNACESFHSSFSRNFSSAHPIIFTFVNVLKEIQTNTYIAISSVNEIKN
ncbi:Uncharacterized protein FWK35_00016558, partial [Aphis craccivora]